MSIWIVRCDEGDRALLLAAARSLGCSGTPVFETDPDVVRREVLMSQGGTFDVVVGPSTDGVADINLAAAIASDGRARGVALAVHKPSGSTRSRAARAGIDHVIDLDECAVAWEQPVTLADDGGRRYRHDDTASADSHDAAIITFVSGRGGVGKTALVATAAAQAGLWDMRVRVLDLDLSCGNLYTCFGLPHGVDLARLAEAPGIPCVGARVSDVACLEILGPCERPEMAEVAMPAATRLVRQVATGCDLLLVDTSTTFTDAVAHAAQLSDRLVIVGDGSPKTMASVARTSGLAVRLGVARTRIARLENRLTPRARSARTMPSAEVGLEAARVFRVLDGGVEVADLLASGQAIDLAGSGSPFATSVATFLAQVLAELGRLPDSDEAARAAQGEGGSLLQGLFGRLREAR